jgi:hypothetical protein
MDNVKILMASTYKNTQHHNPEDPHQYLRHCGNLKSQIVRKSVERREYGHKLNYEGIDVDANTDFTR